MDDNISRIEAALEDHVLYLFTDAGNHAFSAADIRALLDRLKAAEAGYEFLRDLLERSKDIMYDCGLRDDVYATLKNTDKPDGT